MLFLSGLVCFFMILTAEARVGNSSQIDFCTETQECLLFDVICESAEYEVRHYNSVKWVSTNDTSISERVATVKSFYRLFQYISGKNELGVKIEMTTPVVVRVPKVSFFEHGTYTMSFLLPSEYQEDPPKPTNDKVYIHSTPDMKMYVKSYGGMMFPTAKRMSEKLVKALDSSKATYKTGYYYRVGYNSPFTFLERHNEVWTDVDGEPVCPASGN
ncbi:heme-binding protein 2-like [Pholidichthys leucotaenia]